MNEITVASKIAFTGIINNGNLGDLTDESVILEGLEFCNQVANATNLPVKYTAVREDLITPSLTKQIKNILPVSPIKYGNWL